jgi:excisionase family DNA binding protein
LTISTVQAQLLSAVDRARVADTLRELEANQQLPEAVQEPVLRFLRLVAEGRGAYVLEAESELTTTEAAKLLAVSRPFLTRLLDQGRIPVHRTGRDRRIAASDVIEYRCRRDQAKADYAAASDSYESRKNERLAGLAGLTGEQASELGFG